MTDLGPLHGKIGSQHNGLKTTIPECRQQSVVRSQVKAAVIENLPKLNIFLTRD